MVKVMPFDLVAEVRCFFGRVRASSKANFRMRSTPWRREHALLRDELAVGALEHAAADRGIFALGVLAHHVEVDIGLGAAGQRRAHARHQLARAQVHILVEAAADRDQQAPQRDVVRHVRPAHRAQQDRVRLRQALHAVGRHHRAGLLVGLARPVVVREVERRSRSGATAASSTFSASGTVSLPIPSPGTTAILWVLAIGLSRTGAQMTAQRGRRQPLGFRLRE